MKIALRLGCGVLLAALACSKDSPRAVQTAEPSSPSPPLPSPSAPTRVLSAPSSFVPPSPRATVQLLDPGRPPRRRLRYAWRLDQQETLALELRTSAEVRGADPPEIHLPPIRITVAIEPESISPQGDLRFAWHVTGATAATEADASIIAQIADGVRAQLFPVEHLSGTAAVTDQGLSREMTVDPTSLGDGGAPGEMVVQVVQTLRDVAAPFPDEDVGLGARWQKLSRIDAKDVKVAQTESFSLTDVRDDSGSLEDVLAQTASPQSLPVAAGGPSMESMLTSGEWKIHFSRMRLVPRMAFDGTSQMVASHMAVTTHMQIAVEGTVGAAR